MRWTESQFKQAQKQSSISINGSVGGPSLAALGDKSFNDLGGGRNRRERVIESIQLATPAGVVDPGKRMAIYWPGMQLLSLNEILRIDHRQLHSYRCVCHEAVKNAVWLLANKTHNLKFADPVRLTVIRTGRRLVDIDGLYASFKFIIDGFRYCGVLADDDPLHVAQMLHEQQTGAPGIGVRIEIA